MVNRLRIIFLIRTYFLFFFFQFYKFVFFSALQMNHFYSFPSVCALWVQWAYSDVYAFALCWLKHYTIEDGWRMLFWSLCGIIYLLFRRRLLASSKSRKENVLKKQRRKLCEMYYHSIFIRTDEMKAYS